MQNIIPAAIPLARWQAPEWALSSLLDGPLVSHSRTVEGLAVLGADDEPAAFSIEAAQADCLDVAPGGTLRVVREGAPVVLVGDLRLTLDQAGDLGRALVQLVERCESGPAGPDEPCASCGASRAEHRLAVHAFVGGDR